MQQLGVDRPFAATFGYLGPVENIRYDFHRHRQHQLIFPASGLHFIETQSNFYVASPQIALWIPAGVSHATTTLSARTLSVFFSTSKFQSIAKAPAMIRVTPLLHQTMLHTVESGRGSCDFSEALFRVIHGIAGENILEGSLPSLPVGSTESLKRTVNAVMENLETITVRALAGKTGQSERSMRRKFLSEIGMGPELFIQRARLIRSMQLLMGDRKKAIIEIGLEAGYSNHSAFTSAFRKLTGMSPSLFRKSLR